MKAVANRPTTVPLRQELGRAGSSFMNGFGMLASVVSSRVNLRTHINFLQAGAESFEFVIIQFFSFFFLVVSLQNLFRQMFNSEK